MTIEEKEAIEKRLAKANDFQRRINNLNQILSAINDDKTEYLTLSRTISDNNHRLFISTITQNHKPVYFTDVSDRDGIIDITLATLINEVGKRIEEIKKEYEQL